MLKGERKRLVALTSTMIVAVLLCFLVPQIVVIVYFLIIFVVIIYAFVKIIQTITSTSEREKLKKEI